MPKRNRRSEIMKIEIRELKEFMKLLKAIQSIRDDEIEFVFTPDNVAVKAMDLAKTKLVDFTLANSFFDIYNVESEVRLNLPLEYLIKMFNTFIKDRFKRMTMMLEKIEIGDGTLVLDNHLTLVGYKDNFKKRLRLTTFDSEEEEVPTPQINFTNILRILSEEFHRAIKDCKVVNTEEFNLQTESGTLILSAEGEGTKKKKPSRAENSWKVGDNLNVILMEDIENTYSIPLIESMAKFGSQLSAFVTLSFKEKMPLKLTYNLEHGLLEYYIAPRYSP